MSTAPKSKLAFVLEQLFANPSQGWKLLPSGAELRVSGQFEDSSREMLICRPGSRPSDAEIVELVKAAGFDDWDVFWLKSPVNIAWVVEVLPDGSWDPEEFLEHRGKRDAVVGYERSSVKVFEPLRPLRIAAKMPLRELGTRAGIAFRRISEIEADPPEGNRIDFEERIAYLAAIGEWQAEQHAKHDQQPTRIVHPDPEDVLDYLESQPEPLPEVTEQAVTAMLPASEESDRERIISSLMELAGHLNSDGRETRRTALEKINLEDLELEARTYAQGAAAKALGLKKLPNFEELGR